MSAYEDHISVLTFAGLNQSAETNLDLKYAVDGFGFDVENGVMKSVNGEILNVEGRLYCPTLEVPNISVANNNPCSLSVLHKRRNPVIDIGEFTEASETVFIVAIAGGKVYYRDKYSVNEWHMLGQIGTARYDCVTYELNYSPPVEIASVETLIQDGAGYVYFDKPQFKYVPVTYANNAYTYVDKDGQTQTLGTDALVRKPYEFPADALFISDWHSGLWCVYSPPDSYALDDTVVAISRHISAASTLPSFSCTSASARSLSASCSFLIRCSCSALALSFS